MTTNPIEDVYELSPAQQGMLFHDLYAPGGGMYLVQFLCRLDGELDFAAFEQAWQRLLDRHPILRTSFHWKELEKPLQVVTRAVSFSVAREDWSTLDAASQRARLDAWLREDRQRGFDLTAAPLMRCTLFRVSARSHHFLWTFHHLLLDGWSVSQVLREFLTVYEHLHRGKEPELLRCRPFSDYIGWLGERDPAEAESFWRSMLAGANVPTTLPIEKASSAPAAVPTVQECRRTLPKAMTSRLRAAARRRQLTVNNFVQAAWALLLSRYSGERDVVFGVTLSGRPAALAGVESMVGMFINTVPLRTTVRPNCPLSEWVQELAARQADAQQYEWSALVDIQRQAGLPRNRSLFESIVVFENYPLETSLENAGISLDIRDVRSMERTNFPLTLVAIPGPELVLRLDFDSGRYESDTMERLLNHLVVLLEGMAAHPDRPLSEIPILTERERHQAAVDWNATRSEFPSETCLHTLFEIQARKTPKAPAVHVENQDMTYAVLNRRANQLAHYLAKHGVHPGSMAGIAMKRSPEMVIALLAVLKAGAGYVPLDPGYPAERLAFLLEDSQVPLVITNGGGRALLESHGVHLVCMDEEADAIAKMPVDDPAVPVTANDVAYMIYTSGSTGRPKGALIPHRGVVNYLYWCTREYAVVQRCGAPVQSPLGFDLTVTSLLGPLVTGRCAYLVSEGQGIEPLADLLRRQRRYSLLKITPAHLEMLSHVVPACEAADIAGAFIIGGEALLADTIAFWQTHAPATRLINEYGPTETVVGCSIYEVKPGERIEHSVPIGKPIANTTLYVLDRDLQLAPVGVPGELYIGGAGVGYGYWNRPDLTAEKFVPDPFSVVPGARLYRSGDLVRYRADGNLEFLGRIDHQVKVRGYRIEPGEIESVLTRHPAIAEALVAAQDSAHGQSLVAYIVPKEGAAPSTGELRQYLELHLPSYMVPSAFLVLDRFPLSPHGKVDRAALPKPGCERPDLAREFVPPSAPLEEVLAEIWREVLRLDRVGIHDNFFELGGHSLLATQVISRLADTLQVDLPIRRLFEGPTIAGLAQAIWNDEEQRTRAECALEVLASVSSLSEQEAARQIETRAALEEVRQ